MANVNKKIIQLHPKDNVAIATESLTKDTPIDTITTIDPIPKGHKIAIDDILEGEVIYKYAQIIGYAATDIKKGAHVHTHNILFKTIETNYEFDDGNHHHDSSLTQKQDYFMGYQRENGSVGTRNYIAILTSVNCSATAARKIATYFNDEIMQHYPNIDGVVAFVHGTGCGMAGNGDGFEALQRVMWGYAQNPNIAGVLMVGLGCEINQIEWLLEAYGLKEGPCMQVMNIQNVAGLQKTINLGIKKIERMLGEVNQFTRTKCPASHLTLGLQCGGSDAFSGITANPALGFASDLLVQQGGTTVLAETPEIYGAEHLLISRAISKEVATKLIERIHWWEDYVQRNLGSMNNNPSVGNKKGGLSTILEKSLGAVSKGGTSPLMGVYKYAEKIDTHGFVFMDSPGYDPCSVTGEIASGCNMIAFTTGRGSAFGSKPSPCIKIATNSAIYHRMTDDMDINTGAMIDEGISLEEKGKEIYDYLLKIASGQKSKSELQNLGDDEFVPWQIGATM